MLSRHEWVVGRNAGILITLLAVAAAAPPAAAQPAAEEPAADEPTADEEPAADEEAAVDEAPVEEPPPAQAPPPAVEEPASAPAWPPTVRIYGIIKPELVGANGIETFGKSTLTAPTAAAHPISDPLHDEWAGSFQLQQSRFGIRIGEGTDLEGRVEVDFVDPAFAQSSPIQGTRLRLRTAFVTYKAAPAHKITVGQNWDIFSPLNPLTMNLVGASFQAGNTGFMRPQVIYTYGTGQGLDISGAIGMQRQNTGPAFNELEYSMMPTLALQLGYHAGKNWFGVSAIGSSQMTVLPPNSESKPAFAVNAFASVPVTDSFSLMAEAYVSKNSNALGLLSLASGTEITDAGGYVSAKLQLDEAQAVWLLAGAALVLNPDDLALGYTPITLEAPVSSRLGIGGIESNVNLRGTYVVSPLKGLEFYLEPFMFITQHKLAPADDPNGDLGSQVAFGTAIGTRYSF